MAVEKLKEGDKARILSVGGTDVFKNYLVSIGLTKGAIFKLNYSPSFSRLVNLSIGGKMIGLRKRDFQLISFEKIPLG